MWSGAVARPPLPDWRTGNRSGGYSKRFGKRSEAPSDRPSIDRACRRVYSDQNRHKQAGSLMKRAVSVSIGSSKRDKAVEIELLGEKVRIERIGTDGDMEKAAQLFRELDGVVDAFGLGGADLGVQTDRCYYPLFSVRKIVRYVKKTPLVDGAGLKNTLEAKLAPFIVQHLGGDLAQDADR